MNAYSFRKKRNQLCIGKSSARISPTINRVKPPSDPACRSAIFLKCRFSRITAASTLPCLRFCQLLFCVIVSEFCCLEAKHGQALDDAPISSHVLLTLWLQRLLSILREDQDDPQQDQRSSPSGSDRSGVGSRGGDGALGGICTCTSG